MNKFTLIAFGVALWIGVTSFQPHSDKPFDLLKNYMSGSFSSELQSRHDSDYFDIRLRMEPIWKASESEFYLYVEQAMSTALDKPYRQRIYKVVKESEGQFVSYIYTMNAPQRFTGKQGSDDIFSMITPDSLKVLDGCEVRLSFNSKLNQFEGATADRTCPSTRSGATHTTSKVVITANGMTSWDQGWNDAGVQVWGATKGGYEFLKK
jgi:CpeT protein